MPFKPYPFNPNFKDKFLNSTGNWTEVNMAVPTSYSELKRLRDDDELIPGMYYRIIDYNTTTSQVNTQSAGYSFDIIVQALSTDTLSENAKAIGRGTYYLWGKTEHSDEPYDPDDYSYFHGYLLTNTLYTPSTISKTNPGKIVGYLKTDSDNSIDYIADIQDILIGAEYAEPTFPNAVLFNGQELRLRKTINPNFLAVKDSTLEYNEERLGPDEEEWYTYLGTIDVSGDHFTEYNSKLEAWELKYCLDNDTSRFAWADTTNGTGVIYYMKDEYDNECPYDFKNIQFKRWVGGEHGFALQEEPTSTGFTWVFTFDKGNSKDDTIAGRSQNNKISSYFNNSSIRELNNIVLIDASSIITDSSCYDITLLESTCTIGTKVNNVVIFGSLNMKIGSNINHVTRYGDSLVSGIIVESGNQYLNMDNVPSYSTIKSGTNTSNTIISLPASTGPTIYKPANSVEISI